MNIILINHYAGSNIHGMEFRPYYLAREWVKLGHKVTVVAASFSHLRQKNMDINSSVEEWLEGIRYIWLPVNKYVGNGVMRFKNMLTFIYQLYKNMDRLQALRPDVVIASSTYPLDSYPAYTLAKRCRAQFVFELHDLWPLSPMELGKMSKYHPFIMLMQMAEDFWCTHADKVISILPKAKEYLKTRGMADNKFYHVPNGIVLESYVDIIPLRQDYLSKIDELKQKNKFLIGFTGAHGIANALHILIQAADKLCNNNVQIVLVGNGQEKENLKNLVQNKKINNVLFLDSIPKNMVPSFLQCVDCLYIGLQKQRLFMYGISPNKIMDYMMAGKPIISAISSGNDLVQEAGCGISVPAEDVDAVVSAVHKMMSISEEERLAMGQRGHEYVVKNYDYKVLAQRFIDYLQK